MPSRRLGTALLCGCLLALPAAAADKNNKADGKDVDGGALPPGVYAGKLVSVPGSDGSFTLNVETDHFRANPNGGRQAARDEEQVVRLQSDLLTARNPNEYNQRLRQLANQLQRIQVQALKPNGKLVKDFKQVDFQTADGVKVRTLDAPTKFDDKGNPKEYTKAELKELKGKDADLPGYEATPDALKAGQTIKVTLAHPKPEKKDADKDKDDKKKDADVKKGHVVTLIVILADDGDADVKRKK